MVMSMWRGALWFSHGWRHYTRQGFQQRQKHFNDEEMLEDLSGKVYLVTGANSGLGYATAHHLASKGGRVYLLCRSRERGEEAKQTIVERTGNSDLHVEVVDVSEQSSLASFADRFLASGERCDVLINNAGVMLQEKGEPTGDGLDRTFATNTMGCFLLTKLLMPALEKSAPSRVVMVSSGGALTQKLDVEDLEFAKSKKWDGTLAYAQTKRAQIYLAELFAQKYKGNGVYFYSMHPGWADTPGVSTSMPQFYDKLKDRLRTAEQGADKQY
ncbi:Dehydrogenase/reductase SDR member 12, partial [Balamuthia mandrillaris]